MRIKVAGVNYANDYEIILVVNDREYYLTGINEEEMMDLIGQIEEVGRKREPIFWEG